MHSDRRTGMVMTPIFSKTSLADGARPPPEGSRILPATPKLPAAAARGCPEVRLLKDDATAVVVALSAASHSVVCPTGPK